MRNLCKICNKRPVAVNYHKDNKVFYRTKCDQCSKIKKDDVPSWSRSLYQKKSTCDKCGFTSKYKEQFDVYHVDGNKNNCKYSNLKTVCANCQRVLFKFKLPWTQGDLIPDH